MGRDLSRILTNFLVLQTLSKVHKELALKLMGQSAKGGSEATKTLGDERFQKRCSRTLTVPEAADEFR
jgi:hypothetical protein